MSDSFPETNYILSYVARPYLPPLSLELAAERMDARGEFSDFERSVIYTHYLAARGDFNALVDFLDEKPEDERHRIVNHTMFDTYYGNALHACLYWNTGVSALNMYRYLVGCGATAVRDYYEFYPWAQSGSRYVCPLRGVDIAPDFHRDSAEFTQTYADVLQHFGPAAGAGADTIVGLIPPPITPVAFTWSESITVTTEPLPHDELRETCRLHRPNSLYTRNSDGYYGTFTPSCNGCGVGRQEAEECAVADRVRAHTSALLSLWAMRYDNESVTEAQNIAEMLADTIGTLEGMTQTVVTPIDYGRRMLDLHAAATTLHRTLQLDISLILSAHNAFEETIRSCGFTTLNSAPILAASRARLSVASPQMNEEPLPSISQG